MRDPQVCNSTAPICASNGIDPSELQTKYGSSSEPGIDTAVSPGTDCRSMWRWKKTRPGVPVARISESGRALRCGHKHGRDRLVVLGELLLGHAVAREQHALRVGQLHGLARPWRGGSGAPPCGTWSCVVLFVGPRFAVAVEEEAGRFEDLVGLASHVLGPTSSRTPRNSGWRSMPESVHSANRTCATSSGRTHCGCSARRNFGGSTTGRAGSPAHRACDARPSSCFSENPVPARPANCSLPASS